jgi:hypothetical protein
MPADPLKLIALDADDLAVISAHVQDARVQASDIVWRQDEKRLVVGIDRLDWEQTLSGGTEPRRSIARCVSIACWPVSRATSIWSSRRRCWNWSGSNSTPPSPRAAVRCCCSPMAARCGSTSNAWNAS